jgi:hypothetical protein
MAKTDPAQQLHDATKQRDSLAASIPELTRMAAEHDTTRRQLRERLELKEGDALIGKVTESDLRTARATAEQATVEARKADASLREAQANLTRLNDAIARLTPDVVAVRGAFYRQRHIDLAQQLRDVLTAARPINDALHENFRAAETEFTHATSRTGSRPYPPAAGLIDLSWPELRHNPHAQEGGRIGGWCKRVADFINPPPAAPPRARRIPVQPPARTPDDPWHALPQGEVS